MDYVLIDFMLEKFFRMKTRLHNFSDNSGRKAVVEM